LFNDWLHDTRAAENQTTVIRAGNLGLSDLETGREI
jgi:hypothetical protein